MELRRYLAILRRRAVLIVLSVIVGVVAGYASTSKNSVYTAQAKLYVGSATLSSRADRLVTADVITGLKGVVGTYASMIDSRPIAEEALRLVPDVNRSPQGVVNATLAAPLPDTQLILVLVSDPDPAVAQRLTNAMVDAFVEKIQTYDPAAPGEPGQPPQLPAYVFERAALPSVPIDNGLTRRMILGAIFGFLLAAAVALTVEYLDITVKSIAEAERRLELPVLGVIPVERQDQLVVTPRPEIPIRA